MKEKENLMSDTLTQIDDFRRYAERRVAAGEKRSIVELFDDWLEDSRTDADREADLKAVEEALRDFDAGDRGRPYEEVIAEVREKYGLS
jgi:hypothetical protein